MADRVLLINEGKLVFDGAPEELKENGSMEQPFYRLTNYQSPAEDQETVPAEMAGAPGEEA